MRFFCGSMADILGQNQRTHSNLTGNSAPAGASIKNHREDNCALESQVPHTLPTLTDGNEGDGLLVLWSKGKNFWRVVGNDGGWGVIRRREKKSPGIHLRPL
jgi:hypothetical protein